MVRRGKTRRRLGAVALCSSVGLVLAATLLTLRAGDASGAAADRCAQLGRVSAARGLADVGSGRRVVVIGDSYAVGLGLERPAESWPSRLPGRVHVAGFSGTGFSALASPCGRVSYADRAPDALRSGSDLVVVEGGLNDWDRTSAEIAAGFTRLMASLDRAGLGETPVLVVGPVSAPARLSQVPRVDAVLAGLAERHHSSYLSAVGLDLPYLPDGLHLTSAGHRRLGDVVAARVSALG